MDKLTGKRLEPWEEFVNQDEARQVEANKKERLFLSGSQSVEKSADVSDSSSGERRMNTDIEIAKLAPLFKLFDGLSDESQSNIIASIEKQHLEGKDPKAIIAQVLMQIKTHRKFAGMGEKPDPQAEIDEAEAGELLEGIIKRFKKNQRPTEPNKQIDLPFEEEPDDRKAKPWVN